MTKKKWLIILLALFLAAAVFVILFWDSIAVYIMPKAVLTSALRNTISQLQERYSNSPISVIAEHTDPDGRYTAQMELETVNELAGEITYDMSVRMDVSANQLLAEGTASTSGSDLDLSLYMDQNFLALSSDNLLNGAYYGITYETFPTDIRSIPLLKLLIGEDTLLDWDASVANIQAQMGKSYRLPDFSEISEKDLQTLLTAILLLPSDVKQVEMQVGGEYTKCHRITYSATGEQVKDALGYLMDTGGDPEASVSASFYLHENQIVLMHMQGNAGESSIRFALEKMSDDANALILRASKSENGEEFGFYLNHSVHQEGSYTYETWLSYPTFEATGEEKRIAYRWEPVMGELVITQEQPITLNLMETESGFRILTDDFDLLLALFSNKEPKADRTPASCTMTLQKGAEITTPDYKNLDAWSLEDLLILLGGVGSLFGVQLG